MSKFYVGQKVVCIDQGHSGKISDGESYIIKDIGYGLVDLVDCIYIQRTFCDDRFEDFYEWKAKQPKKEIVLTKHVHQK